MKIEIDGKYVTRNGNLVQVGHSHNGYFGIQYVDKPYQPYLVDSDGRYSHYYEAGEDLVSRIR